VKIFAVKNHESEMCSGQLIPRQQSYPSARFRHYIGTCITNLSPFQRPFSRWTGVSRYLL